MSSRRYWLLCEVRHRAADLGQIDELESNPYYRPWYSGTRQVQGHSAHLVVKMRTLSADLSSNRSANVDTDSKNRPGMHNVSGRVDSEATLRCFRMCRRPHCQYYFRPPMEAFI